MYTISKTYKSKSLQLCKFVFNHLNRLFLSFSLGVCKNFDCYGQLPQSHLFLPFLLKPGIHNIPYTYLFLQYSLCGEKKRKFKIFKILNFFTLTVMKNFKARFVFRAKKLYCPEWETSTINKIRLRKNI